LISWCIDKSASSFDVFNTTNQFAVHILASEQEDLCHLFARKGADRFNQCAWITSELQLPIIKDVFAVLQCNVFQRVEAGDQDRKSTRLNSSHVSISYAVFCLKKKIRH